MSGCEETAKSTAVLAVEAAEKTDPPPPVSSSSPKGPAAKPITEVAAEVVGLDALVNGQGGGYVAAASVSGGEVAADKDVHGIALPRQDLESEPKVLLESLAESAVLDMESAIQRKGSILSVGSLGSRASSAEIATSNFSRASSAEISSDNRASSVEAILTSPVGLDGRRTRKKSSKEKFASSPATSSLKPGIADSMPRNISTASIGSFSGMQATPGSRGSRKGKRLSRESFASCCSAPGEDVALLGRLSSGSLLQDGRNYQRRPSGRVSVLEFVALRDATGTANDAIVVPDPAQDVAAMNQLLGEIRHKPEDEASPEAVLQRIRQHRVERKMQFEEFQAFKAAVQWNCFCMAFSDAEVFDLARRAELYEFQAGQEVHVLGEAGTHFFIVQTGDFVSGFEGSEARMFRPGDSFGEIALIHDVRRWATCKCVSGGCLWGVERQPFLQVMMQTARRSFDENLKLVDRVKLFYFLKDAEKRELCKHLVVQVFAPGASVMTQDDSSVNADCVYVLKSGSLAVSIDGRQVRTLGVGDYCGERHLLYNEPRSATVMATVHSMLLRFSKTLLQKVLGTYFYPALFSNMIMIALKSSDEFSQCSRDILHQLVQVMLVDNYEPHSMPVRAETGGVRFLVVLDGEVVVRGPRNKDGLRLHRGESFSVDPDVGQRVADDAERHLSVENPTDQPCKLAILLTDAVTSIITHSNVEEMLSHNQKMAMLRKVYIFKYISDHHCKLIAKSFRTIKVVQDEHVINEGDVGSQLFVIKSGEHRVLKVISGVSTCVRTLGKSDYFGERGLLYNEPRTATVQCSSTESELLVIDKSIFLSIINEGSMIEHLTERIELQQTSVFFEDLREIRVLGSGTYGVVKLVEHKHKRNRYALKCISRLQAIKHNQCEALTLEREILLENDHPFIVKVVRTFKDRRYLYFLTEVVNGGELYDAIRGIGILSQAQAQFYTGSLTLALESLHERNIAYRDLKPENVLLDSQGYVKLIDFGCALKLKGGVTFTLVGTPHYMAPEVILGNGYGVSCDIWSLGVCSYEFLFGPQPFASSSENHLEVFREILTARLTFPAHIKEKSAPASIHFLRCILRRPIENRIGCGTNEGWHTVREHKFFHGFSWDQLLSRSLSAPLVPEDKKAMDEDSAEAQVPVSDDQAPETDIQEDGWDKDF